MDVDWRPLSPALLRLWRFGSTTALALVGIAGAVAVGVLSGGAAAVAVAAVVVVLGALVWRLQGRRFAGWGYAERESDLVVRRGLVIQRVSVVPYGRLQFVDVAAGPLDRRFGIATVVLHTAAAASDAVIPGLAEDQAVRLRDRLAELGEASAAGL